MPDYSLPRSGAPPLRFAGELLASDTTESDVIRGIDGDRHGRKRYHNLAVYGLPGGRFVAHVEYVTTWAPEPSHSDAVVCPDAQTLATYLREYDPLAYLVGWPPLPRFAAHQERLRSILAGRWREMVSRVLSSHPEFAARVD